MIVAYGAAVLLALILLYFFEPTRWIWHILAAVAAVAIGFAQLPPEWNTPSGSLAVGAVFLFLFFWGVAFPVFRKYHFHHKPR